MHRHETVKVEVEVEVETKPTPLGKPSCPALCNQIVKQRESVIGWDITEDTVVAGLGK
jgi:hypothetical protein